MSGAFVQGVLRQDFLWSRFQGIRMLSSGGRGVNGRDSSDAETESECHSVTGGGGGDADKAGRESDGHSATGGSGGNTHHHKDAETPLPMHQNALHVLLL